MVVFSIVNIAMLVSGGYVLVINFINYQENSLVKCVNFFQNLQFPLPIPYLVWIVHRISLPNTSSSPLKMMIFREGKMGKWLLTHPPPPQTVEVRD